MRFVHRKAIRTSAIHLGRSSREKRSVHKKEIVKEPEKRMGPIKKERKRQQHQLNTPFLQRFAVPDGRFRASAWG